MIENKDDISIRLMLGYLCISSEKDASLIRKVEILDRFQLKDAEIALICDCNEQSVRNARQKQKGRQKSPAKPIKKS